MKRLQRERGGGCKRKRGAIERLHASEEARLEGLVGEEALEHGERLHGFVLRDEVTGAMDGEECKVVSSRVVGSDIARQHVLHPPFRNVG